MEGEACAVRLRVCLEFKRGPQRLSSRVQRQSPAGPPWLTGAQCISEVWLSRTEFKTSRQNGAGELSGHFSLTTELFCGITRTLAEGMKAAGNLGTSLFQ